MIVLVHEEIMIEGQEGLVVAEICEEGEERLVEGEERVVEG